MAFENAFLTEEEETEFETKAIPNPGNRLISLHPTEWTIDRERDVFLVWGSQNREKPDEYYFLLSWKGTSIKVHLKEYWSNNSKRIWELLHLGLPTFLGEQRDEIIDCLKEALVVWAFNGSPDEPFNQSTKVEFKF